MKLYRSLGRIWTSTQSDARQAQGGKDFEQFEVPTDKPGLLAFLNTFDVRPGDAPPVTVQRYVEIPDDDDAVDSMLHHLGLPATAHVGNPPPSPDACPACARSQRTAGTVVSAEAAICAAADLEDISDPDVLDGMVARLQERRAALLAPVVEDPMAGVLG